MPTYGIYGITLASEHPFRWPLIPVEAPATLRFDCVDEPPLAVPWDRLPPLHQGGADGSEDHPDIRYHRHDGVDVVRIRGVADHYLFDDRIVCHLHRADFAYLVEIQLLGMVLALWLEKRGVPTLHASCVAVGEEAVAFLGMKGGGKTTAATAMVAAGHPLLADDLLALEAQDGVMMAQPGYPMLRLWPEQVEHFVGDHTALPLVHPAFTKRRVVLGDGFGAFRARPAPLRRIYLPGRTLSDDLSITPVGPRDALVALIRHSFLHEAVHPLGLAGARLKALAGATKNLQLSLLRYPDGLANLPRLVAAVEADVAAPVGRQAVSSSPRSRE